jgi:hypothetical protein
MTPEGGTDHRRPVLVMLAAGLAKRYGGCKPLAPVGLHGEAVIDLNAGDARAAGFGELVLVLGPETGPAITYHVRRCWPDSVAVSTAVQPVALGTAHAVLCARDRIGDRPFCVINSDDVYGVPALGLLAHHLTSTNDHALVAYNLRDTIVSSEPVTRGTCAADTSGWLRALVERRRVSRHDGDHFTADDGLEPVELAGDTPVSMNLWGFTPSIWPVLEGAVRATHPDVAPDGTPGEGNRSATEVLLPEVVAAMVGDRSDEADESDEVDNTDNTDNTDDADEADERRRIRVLAGTGRCVGVTHADDLPVVRTELAEMVGQGLRAEDPWATRP